MKQYVSPITEVLNFTVTDIIALSNPPIDENDPRDDVENDKF